jgi:hypothetical protein
MVWLAKLLPSVCHVQKRKNSEIQNAGNKTGTVVVEIFQFHHSTHKCQYHGAGKKMVFEFVHGVGLRGIV